MREKLFEIVSNTPRKIIWFDNKKVFLEERFGERNNIKKNYRITSAYIEDGECLISYILIGEDEFIHTSYLKNLSNTFVAQLLTEIL